MADPIEPTADAAPAPKDDASVDDLDGLVAEWNTEVGSTKPNGGGDAPDVKGEGADAPAPGGNGADKVAGLQKQFDQFREQLLVADMQDRENADAQAVVADAKEAVAGYPVPDDYAESYMLRAYALDPNFQEAWDGRHDSPAAMERCDRAVKRAIRGLVDSAKKMPDPELTADREAVAMAVRGSVGTLPPSPPPRYGNMSNKDFADQVEREHGFRPAV